MTQESDEPCQRSPSKEGVGHDCSARKIDTTVTAATTTTPVTPALVSPGTSYIHTLFLLQPSPSLPLFQLGNGNVSWWHEITTLLILTYLPARRPGYTCTAHGLSPRSPSFLISGRRKGPNTRVDYGTDVSPRERTQALIEGRMRHPEFIGTQPPSVINC